MKYLKPGLAAAAVFAFGAISLHLAFGQPFGQQGPDSDSSETVARPRKKTPPPESSNTPITDSTTSQPAAPADPPAVEEPKIPSKFTRKEKEPPADTPTFSTDVTTVQLDVAVLDNKGRFLPGIPKANFRVLEDNVPQQIASFSANSDAPMTIALVIEFNAAFQQYWSQGWYETLSATYGFVQTLKPDDYTAIIAYDLRPEILCDFTNDQGKIQEAMQRLRIPGFSESNMFDAVVDT